LLWLDKNAENFETVKNFLEKNQIKALIQMR
jgi:hypothetical protein